MLFLAKTLSLRKELLSMFLSWGYTWIQKCSQTQSIMILRGSMRRTGENTTLSRICPLDLDLRAAYVCEVIISNSKLRYIEKLNIQTYQYIKVYQDTVMLFSVQ